MLKNMAKVVRKCYLKCLDTARKIDLPHKELVTIGRRKEYEIVDIKVSRNQIECTADCEKCQVLVKAVGINPSGCNGYALVQNKFYTLEHSDIIELQLTSYQYEIVFDPPPEDHSASPKAKKMKFDFSIFNMGGTGKKQEKTIESSNGQWEEIDNKELLIYTAENCISQSTIAGFDIDGTVIKTKSGKRFPENADDWVFNYKDIPQKLEALHQDKYKIVFFTNQMGIGRDSHKIKEFKRKIGNIVNKIGIPIQVFVATGRSKYRKPIPGMWNTLSDYKNDNIAIDLKKSFYVGDAAGRPKSGTKKNKDHSCADRLFAMNIGVKFYTPEEYFLKHSVTQFEMPEFDPNKIDASQYPDITYGKQNVILMVGSPGSGKSHFCQSVLIPNGYVYINRDTLGSMQRCEKVLDENLAKKNNVVIDNTNPDKKSRQNFINIAKKHGVDCRCFIMTLTYKHSKHNNRFRELTDKSHQQVSEIIINKYKSNFQEPEENEGFAQIVKIPFIPNFKESEHEKFYKLFLLES